MKLLLRQKMVRLLEDSIHVDQRDALFREMSARLESIERLGTTLETQTRLLGERLERLKALSTALLDDVPQLRRRLEDFRAEPGYESLWDEREPLITIRIATYNLAEILVERALASVRRQTYERFEVIVVGDACTDDTEQRVRAI